MKETNIDPQPIKRKRGRPRKKTKQPKNNKRTKKEKKSVVQHDNYQTQQIPIQSTEPSKDKNTRLEESDNRDGDQGTTKHLMIDKERAAKHRITLSTYVSKEQKGSSVTLDRNGLTAIKEKVSQIPNTQTTTPPKRKRKKYVTKKMRAAAEGEVKTTTRRTRSRTRDVPTLKTPQQRQYYLQQQKQLQKQELRKIKKKQQKEKADLQLSTPLNTSLNTSLNSLNTTPLKTSTSLNISLNTSLNTSLSTIEQNLFETQNTEYPTNAMELLSEANMMHLFGNTTEIAATASLPLSMEETTFDPCHATPRTTNRQNLEDNMPPFYDSLEWRTAEELETALMIEETPIIDIVEPVTPLHLNQIEQTPIKRKRGRPRKRTTIISPPPAKKKRFSTRVKKRTTILDL